MDIGYAPATVRGLRETLGLTQQELAERLAELAWSTREQRVGVNADMVSKWERNQKRPSALYADLLRHLSGAPQIEGCSVLQPVTDQAPHSAALLEATDLLDTLGPHADLLRGHLIDMTREELSTGEGRTRTRDLATLALQNPHLVQGAGAVTKGSSPDHLDVLETMATGYQHAYPSAPPLALLRVLAAHLHMTTGLLCHPPAGDASGSLWANHGQVALLAGRLCVFDLLDVASGRGFLSAAAEASVEAGDQAMHAAAIGHQGLLAAAQHRPGSAQRQLQQAEDLASDCPPLLSWVTAARADLETSRGAPEAALRLLIRARRLLDAGADAPSPVWFDFYDHGRLSAYEGRAYLRAGLFGPAEAALREAEAALPEDATKQRSLVLADLALVKLSTAKIDAACHLAVEAARLLSVADYATTRARLTVLRRELEPWNKHPGVHQLDQIPTSQGTHPS